MVQECKNCCYFLRDDDEDHRGWCRRYPPTVLEITNYNGEQKIKSVTPIVDEMDVCGEFKCGESI